ncbi:hypothetical protein N7G274_003454 [Stereocaulon virgatum]|uniref:Uncharacterized protein n=1 Tax=Stereocaulon virgatum TaxID=373712 RepID=A0ABR4ADN2_9LECA
MSDDECFYDEDDELNVDLYSEAEDLAAHTVHSPVWIDYHPDWDTLSVPSDWEYYSDEYWDHTSPKTFSKKRKKGPDNKDASASTDSVQRSPEKKRRLASERRIPKLSLGEPNLAVSAVIWKSKSEMLTSPEEPTITGGSGETVSLLADWRERFETQPKTKPKILQRKGDQHILAVVVDDDPPVTDTYHISTPPPTILKGVPGLLSRHGVPPPSIVQEAQAMNSVDGATSSQDQSMQELKSYKLLNKATTNERKRKANHQPSNDVLDERATQPPPGRPKKKKTANENNKKIKQPLAARANGVLSANKKSKDGYTDGQAPTSRTHGIALTRKRKAVEEPEDESAPPPPKRRTEGKQDTGIAKATLTRKGTHRRRS